MGQHTAQPQMRGSGPAKTGPRGSDEEQRALETAVFRATPPLAATRPLPGAKRDPAAPGPQRSKLRKGPGLRPPGDSVLRRRRRSADPRSRGRESRGGASARGWRSGTGTGSGPAVAGLPARLKTAGCCSLTRQPRLHGLSPRE